MQINHHSLPDKSEATYPLLTEQDEKNVIKQLSFGSLKVKQVSRGNDCFVSQRHSTMWLDSNSQTTSLDSVHPCDFNSLFL